MIRTTGPKQKWKELLLPVAAASISLSAIHCDVESVSNPGAGGYVSNIGSATVFSQNATLEELQASNAIGVSIGNTSIYVGYQQVTATNQNPILIRFDNGLRTYVRTSYETSPDDSRGYGLLWNGGDYFYAVFTVTGSQGDSSTDFRRFAQNGWLTSYGGGGGARASVIAQIDASSGQPVTATFIRAELESGNTNTVTVTDMVGTSEQIGVTAESLFAPLGVDGEPLNCSGSSPFVYELILAADLSQALNASAVGCE